MILVFLLAHIFWKGVKWTEKLYMNIYFIFKIKSLLDNMWSDVWSGLVGDGDGDFNRAFDVDGVRQLDTGSDSIVEEGQAVDYQQLIQKYPTDVADAHVEGAGVCHSQLQGEHVLAALH